MEAAGRELAMKLATTAEVEELLQAYIDSAALGAALELGLFWLLAERPQTSVEVAQGLEIPLGRCRYWLELLTRLGLLEREDDQYFISTAARTAILDGYSQESWAHWALEWRERFPVVRDLALHIHEPGSVWEVQGLGTPRWFEQITKDPQRAHRFTRLLYEVHLDLADELAATLDVTGVRRLMDLGGGSGVMSLALLDKYPGLTSLVIDIPNVCIPGREIAAERGMADRITYLAADFVRDELPGGFDMVLNCDVGAYSEAMLLKLRAALNADGRLVVVDQFAPAQGVAPASRHYLHWAFLGSLANPGFSYLTAANIRDRLTQAGFVHISECTLSSGWHLIEVRT
jgi:predicted O-methyltransferase YrrM